MSDLVMSNGRFLANWKRVRYQIRRQQQQIHHLRDLRPRHPSQPRYVRHRRHLAAVEHLPGACAPGRVAMLRGSLTDSNTAAATLHSFHRSSARSSVDSRLRPRCSTCSSRTQLSSSNRHHRLSLGAHMSNRLSSMWENSCRQTRHTPAGCRSASQSNSFGTSRSPQDNHRGHRCTWPP